MATSGKAWGPSTVRLRTILYPLAFALGTAAREKDRRRVQKSTSALVLAQPVRGSSVMLEPHQRAARIPNAPEVRWHQFLSGRFLGPTLGLAIQAAEQQTAEHAELRGILEYANDGSLPVVLEFTGALNIETREITVHETRPEWHYSGQFSENGRVLTLRRDGQAKLIYLVHEETLVELT